MDSSQFIAAHLNLLRQSLDAAPDIAAFPLSTHIPVRDTRPCALLLTPHPDDECLTGALPLRLRQEGWQIVNLALTLGSDIYQRARRQSELAKACALLGFECMLPQEDGFSHVTPTTRADDPDAWLVMVKRVAEIIAQLKPQAIFMPHHRDSHPSHIGAYHLGMDALVEQSGFVCTVVQTEYWQPNENPNLMIGVGAEDAAKLLTALTCHAGENARNPFDRRFPAYLIDNVRRGSERVGGQGAESASVDFAMLYEIGLWKQGRYLPSALKRIIGAEDSLADLIDG